MRWSSGGQFWPRPMAHWPAGLEPIARQQGLTRANSFVDLMFLKSRGPSNQGYRVESPTQRVFLRVANSEFKGALKAGLSSREPRSIARSNSCKQLRRLDVSEVKGALKAGLSS